MAEPTQLVVLSDRDRTQLADAYRGLEATRTYPLGSDRFRLDHGQDPFRFFRGLGPPTTVAAVRGSTLLGLATAVRRAAPSMPDAWYACDLKVAPRAGATLAFALVRKLMRTVPRNAPGYAVLMDTESGPDRLARVAMGHAKVLGFERGPTLRILAVDARRWVDLLPVLQQHRGPTHLRRLRGTKDVVLESTGAPMDLRHAQWGPFAQGEGRVEPGEDAVHMLASVAGDALDAHLRELGVPELGRATVLHRGMREWPWATQLSSDI